MTQADLVLHTLQRDGYITALDAILECDCSRLSKQIQELRSEGFQICAEVRNLPSGGAVTVFRLK